MNSKVEGASLRLQKAYVSPQAVESIERGRITATGAFRISDLLKFMGNVQVWEGDTAFTRVSVRGGVGASSPRTVQILVDGVPMFNTVQGAADLSVLPVPVEAVERIEVVRGPSSSLYGANAQQGVILITTRRAREGWDGSVRLGAGENGTFRGEGFFSLGAGDLDLTGGFGASSVRAWSDPYRDIRGDRSFRPENQAHGQTFFLRPEIRVGAGSLWAMVAFGGKRGNPERAEGGAPYYTGLYGLPYQSLSASTAQVGWKQDWSPVLRSEVKAYQVNERLGQGAIQVLEDSPVSASVVGQMLAQDPAFAGSYNPVDYKGTGGSVQINLDPATAFHFVLGADTCVSTGEASQVLGLRGRQRESSSGGYLSADWDLGPFALSGGLRAAHDTLGGCTLSPRLALVVNLADGSVLRGGWFTSTRSPQIFEKRAEYDGSIFPTAQRAAPDLGPEKAVNFEVGWRKAFERLKASVTVFRTAFSNLIVDQVTPGSPKSVATFVNVRDGGVNTGVEAVLRGEVVPGWTFGLTGAGMRFLNPATGTQTHFVPRIQLGAWSHWCRGPWELYVAAKRMGGYTRWGADNGVVLGEAPASTQVDFNFAWLPGKGMRLSLYGVNAARRSTPSAADGTVNPTLVRYARREIGLQFGARF